MKTALEASLSFVFLLLLCFAFALQNTAQTLNDGQIKKVKWQGLSGKNDEFYFLIPEGFQAFADGNYYTITESGKKAQIDSRRTLARYINGVVLMMEFYEGDARNILAALTERQKGQLVKDEIINGFQLKSYIDKTPDSVWNTQYFMFKNRLYVLQAVARSENDKLVDEYLKSVRVVNQKQSVAPNSDVGANSDSIANLPEIAENLPERLDDSQTIEDKPDRNTIILYKPRPKYGAEARRMRISGNVKLRALFSSSGKITKIEVVSSPRRELNEAAIKAAEQIQFLPAEKNGKLVSLYKTVEYNFSTY